MNQLFAILQKYDFSSKSQLAIKHSFSINVVCDTAKVRFFKQITTPFANISLTKELFAILQKYDFSSKSQLGCPLLKILQSCLRYCKSTIFQANHNIVIVIVTKIFVVCDTAKVRFFKQITTGMVGNLLPKELFAILQKYDFSSKSQPDVRIYAPTIGCLRYCKSTIFQANHNHHSVYYFLSDVVCDTAKVRFFKQITTRHGRLSVNNCCLRYCKSTIFQANHNVISATFSAEPLFAILQKYDFSSKSQQER